MHKKKSRMFNFLIELLIVIVFFSLCSIVIVELFIKGNERNNFAIAYENGMLVTNNVAEKMRIYNGEDLNEYLGFNDFIYLNDDYEFTNDKTDKYLDIDVTKINESYETLIKMYYKNELIIDYKIKSGGGLHEK